MSDTISNAEIRIGVDATGATAGLQQVANEAAKAGQSISRTGDGASKASDNVDRASRNMVSAIQRTTAAMEAGGKQTAAYYEAIAQQRGLDPAALAPYIAQLRAAEQAQTAAGASVHEFGFQTAAAKREVIVLAHELSQGNYSKFGGSMLVIAEQTGAAALLFSAAGIAALGLGAAVIGVGAAIAKGASEQRAMNNALIETGNYAGTTATALNQMAHAAVASGGSIGEAKKAVIELAASGKFTGDQIGKITEAAVAMEHAGGQSIEKTIDAFKSLEVEATGSTLRTSEAISRAAIKLDQQYHFLTESVYEQIRALEKEGDQKAASALATDTLAHVTKDRAEEMAKNIGSIQRGWNSVKEAIGGAVDALGNFSKKATPQDAIDRYKGILEHMDSQPGWVSGNGQGGGPQAQFDESRMRIVKALTAAVIEKNNADAAAIKQGKDQLAQQEGTLAASRIEQDNMRLGKKSLTELDDAIQKYGQDLAKIAAANPTSKLLDQDAVNEHIALLRKAHTPTVQTGSDDRAALLQGALTNEQAALDREKSIYDARDKMLAEYHSKLGLSDDEFYAGRAAARNEYIAAEAISFAKEASLIKASQARAQNPQEVATAKEKYDQLAKAHQQFVDSMRNAGGDDAAAAAASTKKQYDDLVKATVDAGAAMSKSLDDQIAKQREHNAEIGKTKEQIELAKQAQVDLATAQLQSDADYLRDGLAKWQLDEKSTAAYQLRLSALDAEIERRRTLANLYSSGADAEAGAKAAADLDKFLDPTKAQAFGNALKGSFGAAADSMTKLTTALQHYGTNQAKIDKARGDAAEAYLTGQISEQKYLDSTGKLNQQNTKNQLSAYGDLAGAAAGFFDEHSRGYQTLSAVSQAFHAAELAMTLAELVPKGISAVLSQGQGDPYSAFGRMAAMAAIVTGLGVAIGGIAGGADTTAKDRQAANGTGSILGDSSAKSDSLTKSLDLIEKNTFQDLAVSTSMLAQLQAINAGINGLGNILYRTDGFSTSTGGTQLGGAAKFTLGAGDKLTFTSILDSFTNGFFGKISAKVSNAVFGGNVHTLDTGVSVGKASLGQINASGATVSQYADTKKDGGLFHSDKYSTQVASLGTEINDQFTKILSGMGDAISQESAILGLSGDAFTAKLDSFVVDIGKISTKDMKPEDVQKALQTALSKVSDDMAKFAVDGLQKFQNAGEGAFETLARIATEYQTVDVVFDSFGKSFGAVGLASVGARDQLVQLSGGLDKFTAAGDYFLKNFFSDQEQAAALKKRIDPTLAQYGLSSDGADASKMFRDFIVGLDTTTEAGAKAYTALMTIAPAFKTVADAASAAADATAQAAADAMQKLKDAASSLLGGVDNSYSILQEVVGREKDILQQRIAAEQAAVSRLQDLSQSIHSTLDSIKIPGTGAFARQAAQSQISQSLAQVKGGGALSDEQIASLKKALSTVTQDSTKQFGSQNAYLYDLLTTRNDIAQLGDVTDDQLSTEQKSLDQLNAQSASLDAILKNAQDQISELKGISTIGLSIEDALHGIDVAIQGAKSSPIVSAGAGINDAYQTSLGRAPDAGGLEFYQNLAAGGTSIDDIKSGIANSAEAQIEKVYKDLLGRLADSGGLNFYMGDLAKGVSIDSIRAEIMQSDEYKKLHPFAVGTNFVPQTMPALVHEGERIIPAADNRLLTSLLARASNPSDNSTVLAAVVKMLTDASSKQQAVIEAMAKDMETMADALKGASPGGSFLRVKVIP